MHGHWAKCGESCSDDPLLSLRYVPATFSDFPLALITISSGFFLILGAVRPVLEAEVLIEPGSIYLRLDQNVACSSFPRIANGFGGFGSFRRGQLSISSFQLL